MTKVTLPDVNKCIPPNGIAFCTQGCRKLSALIKLQVAVSHYLRQEKLSQHDPDSPQPFNTSLTIKVFRPPYGNHASFQGVVHKVMLRRSKPHSLRYTFFPSRSFWGPVVQQSLFYKLPASSSRRSHCLGAIHHSCRSDSGRRSSHAACIAFTPTIDSKRSTSPIDP